MDVARCKTVVVDILRGLAEYTRPVRPSMLLPLAIGLSRSPGWMPSMLPIALIPLTMFPSLLFDAGPVVAAASIATWTTWGVVSLTAMWLGCVESIRYFRRRVAAHCPRFWCEVGRLAWHGIFLGCITMMTISGIADVFNAQELKEISWSIARVIPTCGLWGFLSAASASYLLSLLRWSRPSGRAAECVDFFAPLIISGFIFDYVLDNWPPDRLWPDAAMLSVVALLACTVLASGVVASAMGLKRFETKGG